MKLAELSQLLKATGYPVAYSHFKVTSTNPMPNPPYIVYLVSGSSNLFADNKTYKKINDIQIELYTDKKDLNAEATLEALLDENNIPYDTTEIWIESEQLFQKTYEIGVI
ncbi:hypothetical protein [Sutcliffiella horikoshii]|uniref:Prophage pi2 protein 38 n=1 Tax=Sutcliffiella horikoshii TaxID=79883 RepID=A0A5D4THC7_9BACI|nr:hypothetical protein [Sutcliffiella horikoshii]TYS74519.1 hypothetical protein FZC75_02140 [Sutcliffiella horikoshii]